MKTNLLILFALIATTFTFTLNATESDPYANTKIPIHIIPQPAEVIQKDGSFLLAGNLSLNLGFNKPEVKAYAEAYFKQLANNSQLKYVSSGDRKINFKIIIDPNLETEGYKLKITGTEIEVLANTDAGLFYALQTVRQLLPADAFTTSQAKLYLPQIEITDKPRFGWRGMLLDCGRHFMDINFVKRYIDLLAYHKMNKFHWHLTEDQGWRIEIKKYPKLTTTSAFRKETDGSIYGGFYSQEQIKEVVAYATARNIMVIPEIELPGHSLAALAAYPELSCTGGPFEVGNEWGVFKDIYCAGNEQTFAFLQDVLSEVIQLFPSPYIHIGGDEAPKFRWEHCEKCKKRMQDEKLKNTHELQSYFVKRIEKFLNTNGKTIIGWEEILEGGLAPNATVQAWLSTESGVLAAKSGHNAIMSPTSNCYFDYDIKAINLEKVYDFEPIPEALSKQESKFILGAECNMWTEHAPQDKIDGKIFPRILAMSEVLWTPSNKKNFPDFVNRVQKHYALLDTWGVQYGSESDAIIFTTDFDYTAKDVVATIKTAQNGLQLKYTIDGSTPTLSSSLYEKPLHINKNTCLKAIAVLNNKVIGDVFTENYSISKTTGKTPTLINKYHRNYTGGGDHALTDGIVGSNDFRDGHWQGYESNDLNTVIDLGSVMEIKNINTFFLQHYNAWIFMPEFVQYEISEDGINYKILSKIDGKEKMKKAHEFVDSFSFSFAPTKARYVKVIGKNMGVCPPEHPGAGEKSWIFVDEITVN